LNFGIDFTGGSILELEFWGEKISNEEIKEVLSDFDLGQVQVQSSGEHGIILRMKDISEETHQEVLKRLEEKGLGELRFEAIGPVIGKELKNKTKIVALLSVLAILLYITFAFQKISKPVASWQYGIASLIALGHDIFIPLGVFSLLIRENLIRDRSSDFEHVVDKSLNETLTRSLNTSLTTLFVLFAILFFGGATLKYFALALIIGLICGTYSSLFLASPILVSWLRRKRK